MRKMKYPGLIAFGAFALAAHGGLAQGTAPVYQTPQAALEALVAAMESGNFDAAIDAIDPAAADLAQADDPAEQAATMTDLLAQYHAGYRFVPSGDESVVIELGEDGWPFPVPLVKNAAGWAFDAEAARDELQNREIGSNELEVVDIMQIYVGMQADYRKVDYDGDGVLEFAASIISSEGAKDGLFWPGGGSPAGDLAARASLDGYSEEGTDRDSEPLSGYYFRILTEQGTAAPGGAMSYLANGNMVGGHALLAVPAVFGETGINTFLVSEAGVVYQADLGENTFDIAFGMTSFDPGEGWEPVE